MNNFSGFQSTQAVTRCLVPGPGVNRMVNSGPEGDRRGGWGLGSGLVGLPMKGALTDKAWPWEGLWASHILDSKASKYRGKKTQEICETTRMLEKGKPRLTCHGLAKKEIFVHAQGSFCSKDCTKSMQYANTNVSRAGWVSLPLL